ncbi:MULTISPECIES: DUF4148 domain-containing protein [unclassified Caballeronia]|uniref:DUF4148 domain-containing protein n=1 Tax=unclassified Caballeronia TaxID=2646786 RepID=UPI0020290B67|nr:MULTISPECIES: DUF4148 domain-containing protein [unclassified Caballeronia]MDR5795094.1 DUF4148 domain-containing protein [Caballeronia sp. LZ008]
MNASIATIIAAVFLLPALASAQSSDPVTREHVRAELARLERAGYNPLSNCTGDCPGSLRRAEAVIMREQAAASTAYGSGSSGTAQSGR